MELIELLRHAAREDGVGNRYADATAELLALQKDAGSLMNGIEKACQENTALSAGEAGQDPERVLVAGGRPDLSPAAIMKHGLIRKDTPTDSPASTGNPTVDLPLPEAFPPVGPSHSDNHPGRRGGLLWSADALAASYFSRTANMAPRRPRTEAVPSVATNRSQTDSPSAVTAIDLIASPFDSFRALSEFQKAVERLNGVRGVRVRRFHQGTLHQVVQYEGVIPLEDRLIELVQFKPKVIARGRDRIEIRIGSAEGRPLKASTFD
jgi:hypothetical protein